MQPDENETAPDVAENDPAYYVKDKRPLTLDEELDSLGEDFPKIAEMLRKATKFLR